MFGIGAAQNRAPCYACDQAIFESLRKATPDDHIIQLPVGNGCRLCREGVCPGISSSGWSMRVIDVPVPTKLLERVLVCGRQGVVSGKGLETPSGLSLAITEYQRGDKRAISIAEQTLLPYAIGKYLGDRTVPYDGPPPPPWDLGHWASMAQPFLAGMALTLAFLALLMPPYPLRLRWRPSNGWMEVNFIFGMEEQVAFSALVGLLFVLRFWAEEPKHLVKLVKGPEAPVIGPALCAGAVATANASVSVVLRATSLLAEGLTLWMHTLMILATFARTLSGWMPIGALLRFLLSLIQSDGGAPTATATCSSSGSAAVSGSTSVASGAAPSPGAGPTGLAMPAPSCAPPGASPPGLALPATSLGKPPTSSAAGGIAAAPGLPATPGPIAAAILPPAGVPTVMGPAIPAPPAAAPAGKSECLFEVTEPARKLASPTEAFTAAACIHVVDGVPTLRGQNADGSFGPIQAIRIADTGIPVNVWADSQENCNLAYKRRVVEKRRVVALTPADKAKCKAASQYMIDHVFTREALLQTVLECTELEGMISGKWSSKRAENALASLRANHEPKMAHSVSIKNEALPVPEEGPKPPRILIADGDAGQLMALATCYVLEHTLFRHYKQQSIKGRPREQALLEMVAHWQPPDPKQEAVFIEGDGSAWDTCCGEEIRALIENPSIRHVMQFLTGLGICPDAWHQEHYRDCTRGTMKLSKSARAKRMFTRAKAEIKAFRRSGHRGTSVFNYFENLLLWAAALAACPGEFLDTSKHSFTPRFPVNAGDKKWTKAMGFEGDDSGIRIDPKFDNQVQRDEVLGFWERAGFNMKIFVKRDGDVAEFVGIHFLCNHQGPTLEFRPDLLRNIASAGWTTSNAVTSLAKSGKVVSAAKVARDIAVGAFLCRADSFAGHDDRAACLFLALARGALSSNHPGIISDDALFRLKTVFVPDAFKKVESRIRWGEPAACRGIDRKLGVVWPDDCFYMQAGATIPYGSNIAHLLPHAE